MIEGEKFLTQAIWIEGENDLANMIQEKGKLRTDASST